MNLFRPFGRVSFCTGRKKPKNRQGAASEQITAFRLNLLFLAPWTPGVRRGRTGVRWRCPSGAPPGWSAQSRRGLAPGRTRHRQFVRFHDRAWFCLAVPVVPRRPALQVSASPGAWLEQRRMSPCPHAQRQRRKKQVNSTDAPRRAWEAIATLNALVASLGVRGKRHCRPRRNAVVCSDAFPSESLVTFCSYRK